MGFPVCRDKVIAAGLLLVLCAPPPALEVHQCPEPLWNEYRDFDAKKILEETNRLEALLAGVKARSTDSAAKTDPADTAATGELSALEIIMRLFELSIHHASPAHDPEKISGYVSYLCLHGGPDSPRYLNWRRTLRDHSMSLRARDSLEELITAAYEGEKREARTIDRLKLEMKIATKQRDSLNAVIGAQEETISRLRKLDIMMEQQRNKIQ